MERAAGLLEKATFVMDRGYDDNKMFLKLDELGQDYVIRLMAKRKLLFHVHYKGKDHDAYLSHVKDFSRWRIEEYFRCKKQVFQFENFRIRKLKAINALNFYITLCMAFLAHLSMKPETNALRFLS